MFLINNTLKGINLKRFKLVRLKYSKNIISVSAPQNVVAPARAYIITTQAFDGQYVSIVLIFAKPQIKPIFFEFHKNPVSPKRAVSIEDDALSFVEDMGFEMHDMDLSSAEAQAKTSEVIKKLGIFYYPHPVGVIELQAAMESIIADGSSQVLIESQPIKDSDGDVVADGTSFEARTSHGQIVNPATQERGNPLKIVSKSGFITLAIQSASEVGLATVQVQSKFGNAKGATRVIFIPGEPVSKILLNSTEKQLVADGSSTTMVQSNPITDRAGNQIADGREFHISCSQGAILDPDTRQGGQEMRLPARGAILRFLFRADRVAGTAVIKVQSLTGTAAGEMRLSLTSGLPTGAIALEPNRRTIQVDDRSKVTITCPPITDDSGNAVAETLPFEVSTNLGTLQSMEGRSGSSVTLTTREGGLSFFFIPGTKSGRAKITARAVEGESEGSCVIKVLSGLPTRPFKLQADPTELIADGKSVAVVTTVSPITDDFGNVIENDTPFSVDVTAGRLLGLMKGNLVLAKDGNLSFEYLSPSAGESASITVRSPQDRVSSTVMLKLVTLDPTGIITLTSSNYSLTANETDECDLTSDLIVNSAGNTVPDETVIIMEATLGEFISFDGSRLGSRIEARTVDGVVTGRLRVGRKSGQLVVQARSVSGNAHGELTIPIMSELPEGVITLIPEKTSLPADGKSRVWITSAPVTDANENIVDDGTLISLETERGKIIADTVMSPEDEEGCHVPTKNGIIRFQFQADKRAGRTQVTALSVEGFAMGTVDIEFVSGAPQGVISLSRDGGGDIRVGGEPVKIASAPLADHHGNLVGQDQQFSISVDTGTLFVDPSTPAATMLTITPRDGVLSFFFNPGERPGPAVVSIRSLTGEAAGQLSIPVRPGLPAGKIGLAVDDPALQVAGSAKPVKIVSDIIRDGHGNVIEDGQEFNVTVKPAVTLSDTISESSLQGELYLESHDGRLTFTVKSPQPGPVQLSVLPLKGTANGNLEVVFAPPPPTGLITLRPEQDTLTADGESFLEVTSAVIRNSLGHAVPDETEFRVIIEDGFAFIDNQEKATTEITVRSLGGVISFYVLSNPSLGTMKCSVNSLLGDARGECSLTMVPGEPAGTLVLIPEQAELIAGSSESIAVVSEPIRDASGNLVSDGELFQVTVKGGLAFSGRDLNRAKAELTLASAAGKIAFAIVAGKQPGILSITVHSGQGDARGDLNLTVSPAPSQETIDFEPIPPELSADGNLMVNLATVPIRDIFAQLIPDGSKFRINVLGSIGAADSVEPRSSEFTVLSRDGRLSLAVQAPSESSEVTVSVQMFDNRASGSVVLPFRRPEPIGEFFFQNPVSTSLVAGSSMELVFQSGPIRTDRGGPVVDGERFTLTCSRGTIRDGLTTQSTGGSITFSFHPPVEAGAVHVEAKSVRGNARAQCELMVVAAAPDGVVKLRSEQRDLLAGDPRPVTIRSEELRDRYNNIVADGCMFTVDVTGGVLAGGDSLAGVTRGELAVREGHLEFPVKPAPLPGTMVISLRSSSGTASGEITFDVIPAPPRPLLSFELDQETFLADGLSRVPVRSGPILDIFDQPLADNHEFNIHVDGGVGLRPGESAPSSDFTIRSHDGRVAFEIMAPAESRTITVEVVSGTAECQGTVRIEFVRPEPDGEIAWKSPQERDLILATLDQIHFQSGQIFTNQDIAVLDNEEFLVSCEGGLLAGSSPAAGGESRRLIRSTEGSIGFWVIPRTDPGDVVVTAASVRGSARGAMTLHLVAGPPMGEIGLDEPPAALSAASVEPVRLRTRILTDATGHRIADSWEFSVLIQGGMLGLPEQSHPATGTTSLTLSPIDGRLSFLVWPDPGAFELSLAIEAIDPQATARGEFTFVVQAPVPSGTIVLHPAQEQLPADGRSTTTVTSAVITTTRGTAVPDGEKFLVSCDRGSISSQQSEITERGMILSAGEGVISFALRTSKKAGTSHITIASLQGNAQGDVTITFTPGDPTGNIKLLAEPLQIPADGQAETVVHSEPITDAAGNTVADGVIILIETDLGEFPGQPESKRGKEPHTTPVQNGRISVVLRAATQSGVASLVTWSQSGNAIGNLEVFMTPGPPHGEITLLPSTQELIADGQDIATVTTLPIKDRFGNYITDTAEFVITISSPDGQKRQLSLRPKNSKLDFETSPQDTAGETTITIESVTGAARGSIQLRYQPLLEELDEDEEWFFAESEDDFLIAEQDQSAAEAAPKGDADDLQLSIEHSFSRLLSKDGDDEEPESFPPQPPLQQLKKRQKVGDFFKFFAGF